MPKPRNLLTVATPHLGISGLGICTSLTTSDLLNPFAFERWFLALACRFAEWLMKCLALVPLNQEAVTFFGDFRSSEIYQEYLEYSLFLPLLNNEVMHPDF